MAKIDGAEGRDLEGDTVFLIVDSRTMGLQWNGIVLSPATIDILIGIENLLVGPFIGNPDIEIPIEVRRHVEDEDHALIFIFSFENIDALIGIVSHNPAECLGIIFVKIHTGMIPINEVQIPDQTLNPRMFRIA